VPIAVSCKCGKNFRAPDGMAGKSAKCPSCGGIILIGQAVQANNDFLPPARPSQPRDVPLSTKTSVPVVVSQPAIPNPVAVSVPAESYHPAPAAPPHSIQVSVSQPPAPPPFYPAIQPAMPIAHQPATKSCDFCGESILATARKCKHCGETLDPAMRAAGEAMRMAEMAMTQQAAPVYQPSPDIYVTNHMHNSQHVSLAVAGRVKDSLFCGLLSFIVPGLGQLMRGRIFGAIGWFGFAVIIDIVTLPTVIIPVIYHMAAASSAYRGR
jgi:hypothetical protein